ncbi:MAG: glycosyltransferase family 4 protein [Chloroflexi bacterium]|nr:glycosyltransferase family 4 protein [Chloroflexota bacterium]
MRLYGVVADKLEVIYSACDARFRQLSEREAEAALAGLDVPRPFLLTVGTLEPRKNVSRLIDAFHTLEIPHHLVVVGARGWLYDELLAKLSEPGVIAPERVSDAQLVALYNLADFVVLPSLYEGFGIPALEAMACGTPVACSNVSSLPEVVGDAGLTFDPEDTAAIAAAVHQLACEPSLRDDLAAAGLERARRFSWRESALQLQEVYASLA